MSCDMCLDPDGIPCFPQYGPAPHIHVPHHTGAFMVKKDIPREQWTGFIEDPEWPGFGTHYCPYCGEGKPEQEVSHDNPPAPDVACPGTGCTDQGCPAHYFTDHPPAPDVACSQSRESAMVVLARNAEGEPTVWCDPEIADLVSALNNAGIRTVASCSGHGHRPGNIMLEDGRELIIARNFDEARVIDAIFPGINGEPPKVSLEELGLEK